MASIREVGPSDMPAVVDLIKEHEVLMHLEREHPEMTELDLAEYRQIGKAYMDGVLQGELSSWEACAQHYSAPESKLWVLVDADGGVIGSIGIIVRNAANAELVRMYVHRLHQRRGHARRLFEHLMAHVRLLGTVQRMTLTTPSVNEGAQAFYAKCGFHVDRTFSVSVPGSIDGFLSLTEMAMQLGSVPESDATASCCPRDESARSSNDVR